MAGDDMPRIHDGLQDRLHCLHPNRLLVQTVGAAVPLQIGGSGGKVASPRPLPDLGTWFHQKTELCRLGLFLVQLGDHELGLPKASLESTVSVDVGYVACGALQVNWCVRG
jgi:hypothetical protein